MRKLLNWFKKPKNNVGSFPPIDIPLDTTDYMVANERQQIEISTQEILNSKKKWIAYEQRGIAYYNLMEYDNAISDFENVIYLASNVENATYYTALCYLRKSDYIAAETWFKKVLNIYPKKLDAIYYLGIVQNELNQYDEAVRSFTKCIDEKHKISNAHWHRAISYLFLRKEKEATTDFSLAVENNNSSIDYNKSITIAHIYMKIKEYDKCISICKELLGNNQLYESVYYYLGYAYYNKNDYIKTIEYLSIYVKYNWKNASAYSTLISSKLITYNFEGMLKLLQRYQFLAPKEAYGYLASGLYWTHYKKYDKSLEAYTAALEAYNEEITNDNLSSVAYNNRGYTYAELGRYKEAIADYNTAIQLEPGFVFAHNNRGFAKYKLGDFPEALDDLNKCLTLNPEHGIAYHNRGLVHIALGQKAEACRDFTRAHQLNEPQAAKPLTEHCGTSPDAPTP